MGAGVLVEVGVVALGDGERAGAQANGLPRIEPLRVVELQYQPRQTAERPRAETHRDVGGKPCLEVAAPPVTGGPLALVAVVILGGVKSIAKICSALVPIMALFYVVGCIYILGVNFSYLGEALRLICVEAFSVKAAAGGTAGTVLMLAARYGIARGLFSNESGMGSAPIVAAAAQTRNPVRQALVSSSGTFWDTVVICAITGLVITTSIIAHPSIDYQDGGLLTKEAFATIPYVGTPILTFGILTFSFSTILGWSYYGERSMEYLLGERSITPYRIAWVLLTFVGSVMALDLVWNIADIMNALMAIPNLISLLLLSKVIAKDTQHYLWEGNLDEEDKEM